MPDPFMRAWAILPIALLVLAGCVGPTAPDAAVPARSDDVSGERAATARVVLDGTGTVTIAWEGTGVHKVIIKAATQVRIETTSRTSDPAAGFLAAQRTNDPAWESGFCRESGAFPFGRPFESSFEMFHDSSVWLWHDSPGVHEWSFTYRDYREPNRTSGDEVLEMDHAVRATPTPWVVEQIQTTVHASRDAPAWVARANGAFEAPAPALVWGRVQWEGIHHDSEAQSMLTFAGRTCAKDEHAQPGLAVTAQAHSIVARVPVGPVEWSAEVQSRYAVDPRADAFLLLAYRNDAAPSD